MKKKKNQGSQKHILKSSRLPLNHTIINGKNYSVNISGKVNKHYINKMSLPKRIRNLVAAARSTLSNCSKAVHIIVEFELLKPTKVCFIIKFLYTCFIILEPPLQIIKNKGILPPGYSANSISYIRTQHMRAYQGEICPKLKSLKKKKKKA